MTDKLLLENSPVAEWQPLNPGAADTQGVDYCTTEGVYFIELDTTAKGVESWEPPHLTVEDFRVCHHSTGPLAAVETYKAQTEDYEYILLQQQGYESQNVQAGDTATVRNVVLRFKRLAL
jgi:hypothetical protein